MKTPRNTGPQGPEYYIVPARHLSGTRDEVLEQIDELIQGLIGLRQLVSLHGPKPADAPKRNLRLVKRFINAIFAL
jgi:hypothetical protein